MAQLVHRRTKGTAKCGVALCDGKSKNTRSINRLVTCERCLAIMKYHADNNPDIAEFFGWDYFFYPRHDKILTEEEK